MEDWLWGIGIGQSGGDLTGNYGAGAGQTYSAHVKSHYLETRLAYRYATGDWQLMPSMWLRAQKTEIDDLRLSTGVSLRNSLSFEDHSATIGGIGLRMAYRGWQDLSLPLTPMLALSYEATIKAKEGVFKASNSLIQSQLQKGTLAEREANFTMEPSVVIEVSPQSELILSASYASSERSKALSLRYDMRF